MDLCDVLDVPSFDDLAEAIDLDDICQEMELLDPREY